MTIKVHKMTIKGLVNRHSNNYTRLNPHHLDHNTQNDQKRTRNDYKMTRMDYKSTYNDYKQPPNNY